MSLTPSESVWVDFGSHNCKRVSQDFLDDSRLFLRSGCGYCAHDCRLPCFSSASTPKRKDCYWSRVGVFATILNMDHGNSCIMHIEEYRMNTLSTKKLTVILSNVIRDFIS